MMHGYFVYLIRTTKLGLDVAIFYSFLIQAIFYFSPGYQSTKLLAQQKKSPSVA
jgi:hypothetical protein